MSNPTPRQILAGAAGLTLLGGVLVAGALPAGASSAKVANHEQRGDCGSNAFYDAEVEHDDGGIEGSFEIDGVEPGQKWRIQASHNGDRFLNEVRTADFEREIDVEWFTEDRRGSDSFKINASAVDGAGECSVTVKR